MYLNTYSVCPKTSCVLMVCFAFIYQKSEKVDKIGSNVT